MGLNYFLDFSCGQIVVRLLVKTRWEMKGTFWVKTCCAPKNSFKESGPETLGNFHPSIH